jgi:superfamily II DNA or RNA helicase
MGLRDIHLKKAYSSDDDDILHDFYVPALGNSTEYYRLAGFFSSTSLAVAARGILGLIKNNGTMKLLVSPRLQEQDVEAIRTSSESPEKYFEETMLAEMDRLRDKFVRDHVFALGWMIANNRLEIKVVVVYGSDGNPLSYESIQQRGLFHQKVGILGDKGGNTVAFSGSVNETASGWLENIEEFKVFRSWHPSEHEYIEADVHKFERFWHGLPKRIRVMDVPRAVKERLIEIAPTELEDIDLPAMYDRLTRSKSIQLHSHQEDAVNGWIENGRQGIFEMATGTGKTFAALGCLERVSKSTQGLLTVVTCPYQHLVQQWKREIDKFGIQYDDLITADSANPGWRDVLIDSMIDLTLGYMKRLLVLTTHRTFSSDSFVSIIINNKHRFSALVIGDEVHGLGAEKSQEGLIDEYDLRLGLSATPKRWFDTPGTRIIYDYFGGVIYEFDLRKAINRINPATGQTYLTPYRYMPRFVSLYPEELEEYTRKTRAIGLRFNQEQDEDVKDNLLELLLFKRANIIKNAQAKYEVLDDLLDKISPLKWTIIYCSPQQIDTVMATMNKRRIVAHRFTMEEGTTPDEKYNGLSERQFLLEKFAEGRYQVLVAMRCLDEGVDVPPARTAILMASSGNPRQYVQRIGRVIRRYPGKTEASIYDIVVTPSFGPLPPAVARAEWAIFQKELERYEDIARVAINNAEALGLVYDVKSRVMEEKQ